MNVAYLINPLYWLSPSGSPCISVPYRDKPYVGTSSWGKVPVSKDEFSEFEMYDTPDWDGYGALAITSKTLEAARMLKRLLPKGADLPDIAPGGDGTIGFEWRVGPPSKRRFLLIDVGPGELVIARQIDENGAHRNTSLSLEESNRSQINRLLSELRA